MSPLAIEYGAYHSIVSAEDWGTVICGEVKFSDAKYLRAFAIHQEYNTLDTPVVMQAFYQRLPLASL